MNPSPQARSRRDFLQAAGLGLLGATLGAAPVPAEPPAPAAPATLWPEADAILRGLRAPVFPARVFPVTDFGAEGDGLADARPGVLTAIRRCNAAGGGRVLVPAGSWRLDGPLHLTSGVELHLADGATLRFGSDPKLYLPPVLTRYEGTELFNYSPCIYAYQATNVAITGRGTIDGQGTAVCVEWRKRQAPDRDRLRKMGGAGVPVHERVFGDGHFLRFGLVQFFGCTQVLLEDFTAVNSPFWCLHAVASSHVTVRRVRVEGPNDNNDGFDPESCSDVLIEDCVFNSRDDCIAIKAGRDQDGWRIGRPSENIVIRRCELQSVDAAAIAIGSEMSGGVRHVFVENCRMGRTRYGVEIKGNLDRGGAVEHVRLRGLTVGTATEQLFQVDSDYVGHRGGNFPPRFRDFAFEDVTCGEALGNVFNFVGAPGDPISCLTLRNIVVERAKSTVTHRHANRLTFDNVLINGTLVPAPPA